MSTKLEKLRERNSELQRNLSYLRAINDFSSELLHAKNIDDVVWLITCHVSESFGFEDCVVYLHDEASEMMKKVASYYPACYSKRAVKNPLLIPKGEGIVGAVAQSGLSELIPDTREDKRYIEDETSRLSELTVPIRYEGKVIGVIDSEHADLNFYSPEHEETLMAIANLSSAKIKNLMLSKREEESREKLVVREATNKKILRNALDAVVSTSSDGLITFWNTQAEHIFGWSEKEAVGNKLSELIIPPSLRARHEKGMERYLETGEATVLNRRIEIEAIRKNQSIFPVELTITPIEIQNKLFFNAFIRDITQQKANRENLQRQYREIEKNNLDLDRFVHGVSHDLKGPLVNLQGLFSLLKNKRSDEKREAECYEMIDTSLSRMKSFMDDLLAYSKNSNLAFVGEDLYLNTLLREIIAEHRFMEHAERMVFKLDVNHDLSICTDRTRLRIVFSNLISNAIKYQDLNKTDSFTSIQTRQSKDKVIVVVRDNGLGINENDTERIFDMFYRSRTPTSVPGSGLGLYILKETLNKLEGEVEIESKLGVGTTFKIMLPERPSKVSLPVV